MIFPNSSSGEESTCNAGDLGSVPGLRRSPGVGNGNPLQHSCLGNPMDRGAWLAIVHGVTKSWTCLSPHTPAQGKNDNLVLSRYNYIVQSKPKK